MIAVTVSFPFTIIYRMSSEPKSFLCFHSFYCVEDVELTEEEKQLKITLNQKLKMEKDHDKIKDYFKVELTLLL